MRLSEQGLALIKEVEGLRLEAYLDGGGVPTIGYGHTGPDVRIGMSPITEMEADELLRLDVVEAENDVDAFVTVPLTQCQYDALVSFFYNLGAKQLKNSTTLKVLNEGHYAEFTQWMMKWNKDNGKVVAGLTNRRKKERELFLA